MGEIIATAIGGPAAGQAYAAYKDGKDSSAVQAPELTPAGNLLPGMPEGGPQMPSVEAQAAPMPSGGGGLMDLMTAPGAISEAEGVPQSVPQEAYDNPYTQTDQPIEEEITVNGQGDQWEPRKLDLLGHIGDALLMARGQKPVFRERVKERNIREAMEGFQGNPERAISRVREVDPEAAWKMYEDRSRVRANEELTEGRDQDQRVKAGQVVGSMITAIRKNPQGKEIYDSRLPTLRKYAEHAGYDPSLLPDSYGDGAELDMIASKGLSAYEQERLEDFDTAERRQESYQNRSLDALSDHRAATRAETSEHNDATETISRERLNLDAKTKSGGQSLFSNDRGKAVGSISPDGHRAAILGPDNQWYAFRLRKPGDINSRMRSPGEDALVRKQMGVKEEEE